VVRGKQSLRVECAPAFHYALHEHRTSLVSDDTIPGNGKNASDKQKKALFESDELTMDLRFIAESVVDGVPSPSVDLQILDLTPHGHKGLSISVDLDLVEGQAVTFVLRTPPKATKEQFSASSTREEFEQPGVSFERESNFGYVFLCYNTGHGRIAKCDQPSQERGSTTYQGIRHRFMLSQTVLTISKNLLRDLLLATNEYWNDWIRKSTYDGSWKEAVHRSALALKLLIYEPTGSFMVIFITTSQFSYRCRGCQPNVQSTRVHWRNQKLVCYRTCSAVCFSPLLYNRDSIQGLQGIVDT